LNSKLEEDCSCLKRIDIVVDERTKAATEDNAAKQRLQFRLSLTKNDHDRVGGGILEWNFEHSLSSNVFSYVPTQRSVKALI
jgi:hypothetical protein